MDRIQEDDDYSEQEAQQRLQAALQGARVVQPIKMKDIPRKRQYKARAKKATAPKSASPSA